ncbi:hypothetical protein PIB30_044164 [Stylosanthes scabra]|uniref:Uncharacterized protein n=1 Tax=Stylosanthes scabra TaxID=79078 RepID=A0ABU6WIJ6_9FABA|nr:hypothetical protein [Stylosanthes scabra]
MTPSSPTLRHTDQAGRTTILVRHNTLLTSFRNRENTTSHTYFGERPLSSSHTSNASGIQPLSFPFTGFPRNLFNHIHVALPLSLFSHSCIMRDHNLLGISSNSFLLHGFTNLEPTKAPSFTRSRLDLGTS